MKLDSGRTALVLDGRTVEAARSLASECGTGVADVVVAAVGLVIARRSGVGEVALAVGDSGDWRRVVLQPRSGVVPASLVSRVRTGGAVTDGPVAASVSIGPSAGRPSDASLDLNFDPDTGELGLTGGWGSVLLEQIEAAVAALASHRLTHVGLICLVPDVHRDRLPDPAMPLPEAGPGPVLEAIAERVRRMPSAVALDHAGSTITYEELWRRTCTVAASLVERGLRPGSRVVVEGSRCPGTITAVLAVMAAGGVVVPVDPSYPAARRRLMQTESGAVERIVVSDRPDDPDALAVPIEGPPAARDAIAPVPVAATSPAYVYFTSGTSGVPKAVLGVHGSLSQFVDWQARRFGIGAGDRVAVTKSISFDVVLREVFVPLTTGGTACILPDEAGPDDVLDWIEANEISVLNVTPSHAELWLGGRRADLRLDSLRWVFFSGEVLKGELVERLRAVPGFRGEVVNLYGPTETTMARCAYVVPPRPGPGVQPVGETLPGSQAIVVTEGGVLAGIDEIGEIVIRTRFGTRGYLNAPDRAAEVFVPNPLTGDAGDVVYRTGDLGRIDAAGNLVVLGRSDDQVQILGLRVEPDEVAAVLSSCPAVDTCAVLADTTGAVPRLVAHVVPTGSGIDVAILTGYLLERIPAAMVPSSFVEIDRLPVTANGKLDRSALRARVEPADRRLQPGPRSPDAAPAPRPAGEGTSSRIRQIALRVAKLAPAEREPLVELLRAKARGPSSTELTPLSFGQARLWFLDRLDPGSAAYNLSRVTRLAGPVDVEALRGAAADLLDRHEILRTRYGERDGIPGQIVDPPGPAAFETVDISGLDPSEQDRRIEGIVAEALGEPFDLASGPVWRLSLVRLGPDRHLLVDLVHHIAADGWSMPMMARELGEFYRARIEGGAADLPPLAIQYSDYARWQRARLDGGAWEQELAYWRSELEAPLPVISLPLDRERPRVKTQVGRRMPIEIPCVTSDTLAALARRGRATPFMTSLALCVAFLHLVTGDRDIVVGIPSADRSWEQTEPLVGFFVNTLALRVRPDPNGSFLDLLDQVRDVALRAYEHREVPFEQIVQAVNPPRDPSISPVFQVMFQHRMGVFEGGYGFPGVTEERHKARAETAKFDLSAYIGTEKGFLAGAFLYNTDILDEATAQTLADRYRELATAMADRPDAPLSEMGPGAVDEASFEPASFEPAHGLIHRLAKESPSAEALAGAFGSMSRAELDRRARSIAAHLVACGVGRGDRVALRMAPSSDLIAAILGTMAAGAAYVPLDLDLPERRVAMILDDAAPLLTLVDGSVPETGLPGTVVDVHTIDDEPISAPVSIGPNDPAYVIYTSGSTGRPKGVVVPHRGLAAFTESYAAEIDLGDADRVLQFHSFSFDSSVEEVFPTLARGGVLVLRAADRIESVGSTLSYVDAHDVTILTVPTSYWHELTRELSGGYATLPAAIRAVCIGGEAADATAVRSWRDSVADKVMLVNNYGPTETTVIATSARLDLIDDPGDRNVTIGHPITGIRLHVLDPDGAPVSRGTVGEMFIAGDQVATGYRGRPDLTAERFLPEPGNAGSRMYRTGDRVRIRPDGLVEYLGRADRQVKVRGYRVELDEIEFSVRSHEDVSEAAVAFDEERDRVVAHIVLAGGVPDAARVGSALAEDLPAYMVPEIRTHTELPISHAGKIDRAVLEGREPVAPATAAPPPADGVVERLRAAWCEALSVESVADGDDFFDLGGHSLLAVRLLSLAEREVGEPVPVRVLFEASRFADFVRAVSPGTELPETPEAPPGPSTPDGEVSGIHPTLVSEPERSTASAPPPADGVVERLRAAWCEALSVESVADGDDFFDLGGHSLLAVRLLSLAEREVGEPVPVRVLFEASRFADFVRAVSPGTEPPEGPAAPVGPEPEAAEEVSGPLSPAQQRLWVVHAAQPGSSAYNVAWGTRLTGELDVPALRDALDHLVTRHETLRTVFPVELGVPRQLVRPPAPAAIDYHDLGTLDPEERESTLAALVDANRTRPFDLAEGPVFRVLLVRLGDQEYALHLVVHHIAVDGESLGILRRELASAYRAFVAGVDPSLPLLRTSYRELAAAQAAAAESGALETSLRFWEQNLAGAPPRIELPSDRSSSGEHRAGYTRVSIGEPDRIRSVAARHGATPFMVLLAGLAAFLNRYTGTDDVVIGSPLTERSTSSAAGVVGFFVNTLPIRVDVSGAPTFDELVSRARAAVLDVLDHRDIPFDAVVERIRPDREPGVHPVFQILLDLKHVGGERVAFEGLDRSPLVVGRSETTAKYDMTFEAFIGRERLAVRIEYDTGRFGPELAERMAHHLERLLESAVDTPGMPIDRLGMLGEADERWLVEQLNATGADAPLDQPLFDLFRSTAREAGDRVALVEPGRPAVSYRELLGRAERLADRLRSAGVTSGDTVGLRMPRSVELVVSMLAVSAIGAVYVPLDPGYPEERIDFMMRDAAVSAVVTSGPEGIVVERVSGGPGADWGGPAPAYVMYTSGSTGDPKGVVIPSKAVVRLVRGADYVQLGPDDVVAHLSNTSFDAATWEVWGSLLNGARLVVFDQDTVTSPSRLGDAIRSHDVTAMFVTTALFNLLSRHSPETFGSVRHLLFGGEAVDVASVRRVIDAAPPARLLHVYGPTEATTFSAWHRIDHVDPEATTIPIGLPIANTTLHVLDDRLQPVPPGVAGELFIGGPGLADGYLGAPDLTAERFVRSPFEDGERLYRTGDLARRRQGDGAIEFIGRRDRQVKLRGFRIELGEVESALAAHPAVASCLVAPVGDGVDHRLEAFVIPVEGGQAEPGALRRHLVSRIPGYMIPAAIKVVAGFPLTPNGKVDVGRLEALPAAVAVREVAESPRLANMVGIWREVMHHESIGPDDRFFDSGGTSLRAVEMLARVEDEFGANIPLSSLFEFCTPRALLTLVDAPAVDIESPRIVPIDTRGDGPPLFCLPPGGGNVFIYAPMARHLDGMRPVFGLPARGSEGELAPARTIEEAAAWYLEILDEVYPDGPVYLVGYSIAGLVAFEVARMLLDRGREVAMLLMVDSTFPLNETRLQRWGRYGRRMVRGRVRAAARSMWMDVRSVGGKLRYGPRWTWYAWRGKTIPPLLAEKRLTHAGVKAHRSYVPTGYPGKIVYIRATGVDGTSTRRPDRPWSAVAGGGVDVYAVPGAHAGPQALVEEPFAERLAEQVAGAILRGERAR